MAKRLLRASQMRLRSRFLSSRQWGVALPGGAEALIHWRSTVEELASSGVIPPVVAFDLDLQNMFGSIEWPQIRASVARHFPEAQRWTEWAQQEPAVVQLPAGGEWL
eukprot:9914170-Karenia_brevis.AAC.1